MLRPEVDTRGRGLWNKLHHNWGRITIIGGMGNAILGALLIHDYKDESYLHWLLPVCILVGVIGILAIVLEAFKLQVGGLGVWGFADQARLPLQAVRPYPPCVLSSGCQATKP